MQRHIQPIVDTNISGTVPIARAAGDPLVYGCNV